MWCPWVWDARGTVRCVDRSQSGHIGAVNERRAHPRRSAHIAVRVASSAEVPLPSALTVDVSRGGVLLAFAEPVGFAVGHRLLMSLDLRHGQFHALGQVARVERGDDFRTYVATEFVDIDTDDYDELTEQLSALEADVCRETVALVESGGAVVDVTVDGLIVEGPNSA